MPEHSSFQNPFLPPGEPIPGKTYRADGWAYIDPGCRLSTEAWEVFIDSFGEDEIVPLAVSSGIHPSDGKPFIRGQLLVSPRGMENARRSTKSSYPPPSAVEGGDYHDTVTAHVNVLKAAVEAIEKQIAEETA